MLNIQNVSCKVICIVQHAKYNNVFIHTCLGKDLKWTGVSLVETFTTISIARKLAFIANPSYKAVHPLNDERKGCAVP